MILELTYRRHWLKTPNLGREPFDLSSPAQQSLRKNPISEESIMAKEEKKTNKSKNPEKNWTGIH